MSIARINSVEFETEEQLQERTRMFDDKELTLPLEAEAVLFIKTGPTTALSILVYPDQETADASLETREKLMSTAKFKDQFYLEGEVQRLQINKRIY